MECYFACVECYFGWVEAGMPKAHPARQTGGKKTLEQMLAEMEADDPAEDHDGEVIQ